MIHELSSRFIEVIKRLKESGIVSDNKEFAAAIGVSNSMITEIYKGRSNVGMTAIQNTVLQFSVSADWLITGRGSMFNNDQKQPSNEMIVQKPTSIEESIIYKMYEKKDEENKSLLKEIGCLEERIRQLEAGNLREKTDAKDVSIKKHSSSKTDDAGSAIVR